MRLLIRAQNTARLFAVAEAMLAQTGLRDMHRRAIRLLEGMLDWDRSLDEAISNCSHSQS